MQICTKYGKRFDYLGVLFSVWKFKGYETFQCNSCKTNYKITVLSRIIIVFLIGAVPLVFNRYFFKILDNSFNGYIFYLMALIHISPLVVRFKKDYNNISN